MSAILEDLNKEQRQAVECVEGPVLIVAGAGSGKTRVLTSRIAYMIEKGTDPSRILALTFTKKAAGEMKERIGQMVGERKARRIWMGTLTEPEGMRAFLIQTSRMASRTVTTSITRMAEINVFPIALSSFLQ